MRPATYLLLTFLTLPAWCQKPEPVPGIPVTNALVIERCGTCHTKDDKGNLSRISYVRASPEGWEEAIKRMVRLNGLKLTPPEARAILKYLATDHGLAPEEAKPVMYMAEHRIQDEVIPNETIRGVCMNCHALGKPFSWRRTREDWALLANFHIASYAQAEAAFRRSNNRGGGGGGRAGAASTKIPLDDALDFLGRDYGLQSPEWSAWKSRMRTPKLAGTWKVSAHVTGKGRWVGEMTIKPGAEPDEFTTQVTLRPASEPATGTALKRMGAGLVYAGYSWRGRSKGEKPGTAPNDLGGEMRETLWFAPDQSYAEGRWFWGNYQEFGMDVKLTRVSSGPMLTLLDHSSLKQGTSMRVRLSGANLPADLTAKDLDFGSGVTVKALVSHSNSEIVADVDVAANAIPGKRDVLAGTAVLPEAFAVYDRVDYIKVGPESTLARLGSDVHPKGYMQFEAIGYHRGADGKPHTADDVELGAIEADWSMEEFLAVYGDDDTEFVGSLSQEGLFTPSSDGPNPQRKFSRNNYGDVWIVAKAKTEKDPDGKPLMGKSYLVVTVPAYIRWDQPEVEPELAVQSGAAGK